MGRAAFIGEFFPGEELALTEGAAGLATELRPRGLAELRGRAGFTQAQVAQRLGVRQERVSAMERGELAVMEARSLAAYVAALGGRLELTAELGAERVTLG